ncbi:hypothetical protein F4679DRAFT_577614 [Xylaria curta]|nr:hypothetical protein F4679DRAFT_577614 [Xylaria curta]
MEENIEEQIIAESSNETLSDLRELTIQCRALLHQLSFINRPTHTDRAEASDLMASFNIWAANMGVFRTGRQSLTFRLKSAPDISKLVQQLLVALKRNLAGLKPVGQSSEVFSNTIVTKLDLKRLNPGWNKAQRAGSVASVQIPASRFPSIPKLDPGGISFTCPYCFLICPAKEASGQSQWRSHLIHDFEPFFCVFDDCSSPFTCADTYTGWLAHMRDAHTQPEWYCWHCKTASYPLSPFSTSEELEDHLKNHHREEITDSLRSTLVKHSMIRDQYALHECPFCNGFPEEIEKNYRNRDSEQARESLSKHVRDHLVSVALILAPLETGESGGELDDTKSEAQRDNNSERDFDGVGDTYELECGKSSCDCKDNPDHDGWEMKDMRAASDITQLWRYILDEKMSGNWMNPTQEPSTTRVKLNQLPQRPPSPIVKSPNFDKRDASQKGHSSTLSNMATMASIYRSRGQWDAAEKLEMEVMETSSAVLGPEHSATLNSVANLASIYQIQTRWKEAELLLTRPSQPGFDIPKTKTMERSRVVAFAGNRN